MSILFGLYLSQYLPLSNDIFAASFFRFISLRLFMFIYHSLSYYHYYFLSESIHLCLSFYLLLPICICLNLLLSLIYSFYPSLFISMLASSDFCLSQSFHILNACGVAEVVVLSRSIVSSSYLVLLIVNKPSTIFFL